MMLRFKLKDNSLSIVLFLLFLFFLIGQFFTGFVLYNNNQLKAGLQIENLKEYLTSGSFLNAVFINWQAAFLQLFALIVFSVFLVQKGASHSRNPNFRGIRKNEEKTFKSLPFPQNVLRLLYENSLSLVLLFFFLVSFILHIYFGLKAYNEELQLRSQLPVTLKHYLSSNRFWFENLSTWQAEFMAIFGFIVASIYFRQRGSAESKPVDASDDETGIHE
jgi:hypothetical protein